jgi:hypothetical protein
MTPAGSGPGPFSGLDQIPLAHRATTKRGVREPQRSVPGGPQTPRGSSWYHSRPGTAGKERINKFVM